VGMEYIYTIVEARPLKPNNIATAHLDPRSPPVLYQNRAPRATEAYSKNAFQSCISWVQLSSPDGKTKSPSQSKPDGLGKYVRQPLPRIPAS
jgi:hypothetical protein